MLESQKFGELCLKVMSIFLFFDPTISVGQTAPDVVWCALEFIEGRLSLSYALISSVTCSITASWVVALVMILQNTNKTYVDYLILNGDGIKKLEFGKVNNNSILDFNFISILSIFLKFPWHAWLDSNQGDTYERGDAKILMRDCRGCHIAVGTIKSAR